MFEIAIIAFSLVAFVEGQFSKIVVNMFDDFRNKVAWMIYEHAYQY